MLPLKNLPPCTFKIRTDTFSERAGPSFLELWSLGGFVALLTVRQCIEFGKCLLHKDNVKVMNASSLMRACLCGP